MDEPASRTGRLLGLPLLVVLASLLGGGLVGFGVGALALSMSPREGFADLGAVILGVMAAAVVAQILWVIGMTLLTRRMFPAGERLLPMAIALGLGVVGSVIWVATVRSLAADAGGVWYGQALWALGQLLLLTAGSLGFWLAERSRRSRAV